MSLTLRPIHPDDQAFLIEVYASTRADELALVPWDAAQKEAFLKMQFNVREMSYQAQYPQAEQHVIMLHDQAVGRLIVNKSDEDIRLVDIALLPAYRSAGIGTTLIGDLLAEARAAGKPVRLRVLKSNRALGLYQRLGFIITDDTGAYYDMEWRPPARDDLAAGQ
ncbi:MAG: GNAT family N-acetyltransferase [Armatimonadota bacterium]|nr:GNAT family N-acetyltransferase [Armatimonadota bacterium]